MTESDSDTGPIRSDLYCFKCGYNQRGLSGDPVRCPECGDVHRRADLEIPAAAIRAALGRLETAPAYNFLGLIGAPLLAWLVVPVALTRSGDATVACLWVLVFGLMASVPFTLLHYRRTCRWRPGWLAALLRFHVGALAMLGLLLGLVFGLYACKDWLERWYVRRSGGESFMLVLLVALLVLVWLMKPIYRWTKAPMEALQRDVAVEIAREELRRHAARRPGGISSH